MEELSLNNICYEDVHGKNFLVIEHNKIRLIDFSDHRIKIGETYNERFYSMFQNFNSMVNRINFEVLHLEDTYNKLIIPPEIKKDTQHLKEDFDFIRNQLKHLHKEKKETKKR